MNACAYLMNMVLRTKKYRKSTPRSTHGFSPCSIGNSIPSPMDNAPDSEAPLLTASIVPGPPPVIAANPCAPSAAPSLRPVSYSVLSRGVRAEPNTVTARGTSANALNPSTNSDWIRNTRHGSVCTQSVGPRESSSRWSVVSSLALFLRNTTGPRRRSGGAQAPSSSYSSGVPVRCSVTLPAYEVPSTEELAHDLGHPTNLGHRDLFVLGMRQRRVTGPEVHRRNPQRREPGHIGPAELRNRGSPRRTNQLVRDRISQPGPGGSRTIHHGEFRIVEQLPQVSHSLFGRPVRREPVIHRQHGLVRYDIARHTTGDSHGLQPLVVR